MKKTSLYRLIVMLVCVALVLPLTACGGHATTPPTTTKPGEPLDPQGNWLFTFTSNTTLVIAGQLLELNVPTVTSRTLAPIPSTTQVNLCDGNFSMNGQASGTDSITLTAQQSTPSTFFAPANLTLTGTIAADQAHMSGTYTTNTANSCVKTSGTWTASLLPAVTGTWTGTLGIDNAHTSDLSVTANLTEITDQTSPNMGQVTGTFTLSGSQCFATNETVTIATANPGVHLGETFNVITATNQDGISLEVSSQVSPDGHTFTPTFGFKIHGGTCDGQSFQSGTLAHP